jgi:hypothetical protein
MTYTVLIYACMYTKTPIACFLFRLRNPDTKTPHTCISQPHGGYCLRMARLTCPCHVSHFPRDLPPLLPAVPDQLASLAFLGCMLPHQPYQWLLYFRSGYRGLEYTEAWNIQKPGMFRRGVIAAFFPVQARSGLYSSTVPKPYDFG